MRRVISAALMTLLVVPAFASNTPKTEEDKTLYAIGSYQARQLAMFNFTPEEFNMVQQGFADSAPGKQLLVDVDAYGKQVQELAQKRRAAQAVKLADLGKMILGMAASEPGAVKTGSGLVYKSLKEGSGASPTAIDTVKVHYRGNLVDGQEFDSSYKRNEPAEFPLNGVIKCWTEGVQKMKPGGKAKLVCPPDIAYGVQGNGSVIPPNSTLIFEVELLEVKK